MNCPDRRVTATTLQVEVAEVVDPDPGEAGVVGEVVVDVMS